MAHQNRYIMRDQVREQIRSIMGDEDSRRDAPPLGGHFFATGVVAFFYTLIIVLGQ
ncbi:MAG: hypothetical protein PVG98_04975 [Chromatiales bacterium]